MTTSVKIFLCLAVVVCLVQLTSARPRLDGNFLENVKFDLNRKCMSLEKDFEKDSMNIRHKVTKEAGKLMKKTTKDGAIECIESARLQAEEQLEEKSQEALDCVRELKDTLDTSLEPEAGIREVMAFRNDFKNKLNVCKKTAKVEFKGIQNNFSLTGKRCLV